MAYGKGPEISIDCSASLLPCNLSIISTRNSENEEVVKFAVVHNHLANSGVIGSSISKHLSHGKDSSSFLTQAKWCQLENSVLLLVLTSYKGIQIYNHDGTRPVYSNKFQTPAGSLNSRFARGVACTGDLLCVGTSEGTILVLRVTDGEDGVQVVSAGQLVGHRAAISDMTTITADCKGQIASADEQGTISIWSNVTASANPIISFMESSGMACLCLSCWKSLVIGGFANGKIRLYNILSGTKLVEVAVHGRPVTALDVAPAAGLLLTASEDSTVSVWSLPLLNSPMMSLVHMEVVEDAILCGAKFMDARGCKFAVTSYDSHDILIYNKQSTPV